MRCFIAIDVDNNVKEKVKNIQDSLKKLDIQAKFVEKENLHFTIVFIGEVSEREINEIIVKVNEVTENIKPFKINIQGLGFFGNNNYIRVVWAGVSEGVKDFSSLVNELKRHVKIGEFNNKPHLTLCRIKGPRNKDKLIEYIEGNKDIEIGEFYVNKIILKSSTLTRNGPIYENIREFTLNG